jgi:hypothetical protein
VQPGVSAVVDNSVGSADKTGSARPETRPPDWKAVEELLGLFARAIQQLHNDVVCGCQSALFDCAWGPPPSRVKQRFARYGATSP